MPSVFDSIARFLNAGIAGSEITPLRLLVVLVLMSALLWATRRITHWFVDRVLAGRGVEVGLREALGAILRYGLVAIGALVILQGAGIDLTSLNVLIGAIGVGLGFGLQAVTSNFFSGLIILFERPIKIGDRVEIAGAISEVREIAARATTLVTDENVAIVVPNSQFISERVTNWSRPGRLTAYRSMCRTRPTPNWSASCCLPPPPGIPTCCPSRLGLCEHIAVHGHQPHEILLTSQQLGLEPNATST
jgi:small-conductance mechanosensitive channel